MEFIDKTLGRWMEYVAQTHPDKEAVIFDDDIVVAKGTDAEYSYHLSYRRTYSEFNRDIPAHFISSEYARTIRLLYGRQTIRSGCSHFSRRRV